MAFEKPAIVIDNGSFAIKAGFACDNHPLAMFRTAVARPSRLNGKYGRGDYAVLIGDEAVDAADYTVTYPVERGRIVHWDNMERIWHSIFYKELKAAPEDRSVLIALDATTLMAEKIKCCEVFFETLNCPAICVQSQGVLALYGSGCTTGIAVDLGHDSIEITPVYEGGHISYARMSTGFAGRQLEEYISKSLKKKYPNITNGVISDVIRRHIYITKNAAVTKDQYNVQYRLPGGEKIDVSDEAFFAGEMFFQPDLIENNFGAMSLQEAVVTAALKCDSELRPEMYEAVVPCGGLSVIPGLNDRLGDELEEATESPVCVLSSPEPYVVSWLGGATFAGITDGQKMWVTKGQFSEHGAKIVKNKFL